MGHDSCLPSLPHRRNLALPGFLKPQVTSIAPMNRACSNCSGWASNAKSCKRLPQGALVHDIPYSLHRHAGDSASFDPFGWTPLGTHWLGLGTENNLHAVSMGTGGKGKNTHSWGKRGGTGFHCLATH